MKPRPESLSGTGSGTGRRRDSAGKVGTGTIPPKRITPRKSPRPKTASGSPRNTLLDDSINKVAQSEPFNGSPEIQRVSEGKLVHAYFYTFYTFFGPNNFDFFSEYLGSTFSILRIFSYVRPFLYFDREVDPLFDPFTSTTVLRLAYLDLLCLLTFRQSHSLHPQAVNGQIFAHPVFGTFGTKKKHFL